MNAHFKGPEGFTRFDLLNYMIEQAEMERAARRKREWELQRAWLGGNMDAEEESAFRIMNQIKD